MLWLYSNFVNYAKRSAPTITVLAVIKTSPFGMYAQYIHFLRLTKVPLTMHCPRNYKNLTLFGNRLLNKKTNVSYVLKSGSGHVVASMTPFHFEM